MNTPHDEDLEMQAMMKETPLGSETPAELKSKLRSLAASTPMRRLSPWPARLALAGVAVVALAAVFLSGAPVSAEAKSFEKVVQATEKADSFEMSIVSNEEGKDHKFAIAWSNGRFGMRADEGALMQFDNGKLQIYDPKENTITVFSVGGLIDPKMIANEVKNGLAEGMKEMDLKKMLHEFEAQYGKENITIGPIVHRTGGSTYQVDLQKPGSSEHVKILVDADTDLPKRLEVHGSDDGRDKDAVIEMKFGTGVDIDLANPHFPAGAKRIELDINNMIGEGLKHLGDGGK